MPEILLNAFHGQYFFRKVFTSYPLLPFIYLTGVTLARIDLPDPARISVACRSHKYIRMQFAKLEVFEV
ncbi:MAG: hypothetical protein JRJ21_04200 [Deltaproteobacteria bacterium]|nr:hypothetical protein [Deltaproteobacteria bacterium]